MPFRKGVRYGTSFYFQEETLYTLFVLPLYKLEIRVEEIKLHFYSHRANKYQI